MLYLNIFHPVLYKQKKCSLESSAICLFDTGKGAPKHYSRAVIYLLKIILKLTLLMLNYSNLYSSTIAPHISFSFGIMTIPGKNITLTTLNAEN